jgi:hypothetical protein
MVGWACRGASKAESRRPLVDGCDSGEVVQGCLVFALDVGIAQALQHEEKEELPEACERTQGLMGRECVSRKKCGGHG